MGRENNGAKLGELMYPLNFRDLIF